MSATGKGTTLIYSDQLDGTAPLGGSAGATRPAMTPVFLNAGDTLTFSHFVGRKAWQVLITSGDDDFFGSLLWSASHVVTQTLGVRPLPDTVSIYTTKTGSVYVSIRWEENSTEVDAIPVGSPSVEIVQAPPQIL